MINFHQVHKAYRVSGQDIPALQPSDLQIARGEVFGIIGHSGAGKSTLLRLINRLEDSSGGKIFVDGEEVTALDANALRRFRQQVGMIFQHFNLLASKTVADNVALPLTLAGELSRKDIDARVSELLARVGLSEHAKKYPAQLFEAIGYVFVFAILFYLYWRTNAREKQGYLFGLFLVMLWTIRFLVEFVKESQGGFESALGLFSTGQWLSLPFIAIGAYLINNAFKTKTK